MALSRVLERYMPKIGDIQEIEKYLGERIPVSVTESLDLPIFDIMFQRNKRFTYRLDGEQKSEKFRKYRERFLKSVDITAAKENMPIDNGIIRCFANDKPWFFRVFMVVISTNKDTETKCIPFKMIEQFCQQTTFSHMPTIYYGDFNKHLISTLVDKNILGVPKNGLLIIPDVTPTEYIKMDFEDDLNTLKPKVKDIIVAKNLCNEFAVITINDGKINRDVQTEEELATFIRKSLAISVEDMVLDEYIDRCKKEAGVEQEESKKMLLDAAILRANNLYKQFHGSKA